MENIDAVITWVNGNDPKHKAKRRAFQSNPKIENSDDIGGDTRYSSLGEINYCVASILKFAPFINKIFIVSDEQNPELDDFISLNFPENKIPIEIVDHKVIFRGYENNLPTFCSKTIESMLFRIPNLSQKFVYFNDDMMLLSAIKPTDWFVEDKIVCYGKKFPVLIAKLLKGLKPKKNGLRPVGYKDGMLNAAKILNMPYFRYFPHASNAQHKDTLENFYQNNLGILQTNIEHKFRSNKQYNPQQICVLLEEKQGKLIYKSNKNRSLFLKPNIHKKGYMARKLNWADNTPSLMFGCINSLDKASQEEQNLFNNWIKKRLELK